MLQWGRDLTVADRHKVCLAYAPDNLLQWGRDLTVADRVYRHPPRPCLLLASMGPRPDGRG